MVQAAEAEAAVACGGGIQVVGCDTVRAEEAAVPVCATVCATVCASAEVCDVAEAVRKVPAVARRSSRLSRSNLPLELHPSSRSLLHRISSRQVRP